MRRIRLPNELRRTQPHYAEAGFEYPWDNHEDGEPALLLPDTGVKDGLCWVPLGGADEHSEYATVAPDHVGGNVRPLAETKSRLTPTSRAITKLW